MIRWPQARSTLRLLEPWRTRVLWLSLGLNLFALALMAAPHLWHRRPMGPPGFATIIERMARDLPAQDAAAFRAAMAREQPWYEMTRSRLDDARTDVARQVAREPYDPAAVKTAMLSMQDRLRESTGRFDESLVAALGGLSPEARKQMSASLQRRRP